MSRTFCYCVAGGALAAACVSSALPAKPISLHPENPHYFLWRGKPVILITSAEHYGAVLNRDFDYKKYLAALAKDGLNLTRTFSGVYFEHPGAFKIERNTLAPAPGRYIGPWKRTDAGGYDLSQWDDEYFSRLKDFVTQADATGVVVEMTLFCPFYDDGQWALSPMNPKNNIQGAGPSNREHVYTLDKNAGLLPWHEAVTKKIVGTLKDSDNVIVEICNEPYFGGVTLEWQHHIAETIVGAEAASLSKHLISQNVANGKAKVENPHAAISVFNFHYATPPDTVGLNFGLNKPIGDNETGFKGTADRHYRIEGWEFLLAGGALYNNLDYSFTVGHEDGTFPVKAPTPGGGGPEFRRQLNVLRQFINGFDFVKMRPSPATIKGGAPKNQRVQVLAEPGRQYALYATGGGKLELTLDLPGGRYRTDWINPLSGATEATAMIEARPGGTVVASPPFAEDIALRILRQ